jgi:dTDP-4-amino-4,6-dideoxygalactose transaminase
LERYVSALAGLNNKLDELRAALLRVSALPRRRERAPGATARYALLPAPRVRLPRRRGRRPARVPLYVVRTPRRDDLAAFLRTREIGTGVHYPVPVHRQPAYAHLGLGEGSLPATEAAAREILSLPLYPELSEAQVRAVAGAIREWAVHSAEC